MDAEKLTSRVYGREMEAEDDRVDVGTVVGDKWMFLVMRPTDY